MPLFKSGTEIFLSHTPIFGLTVKVFDDENYLLLPNKYARKFIHTGFDVVLTRNPV